jgi:hypothetical protein
MDPQGWPLVDVWVRRDVDGVAAALQSRGVRVQQQSQQYHLVEAWIDPAAIPGIAAMPDVLSITPVFRPILRAGKATSQGDVLLHADDVRDPAQFPPSGFDGAGIKVGVLSDSVGNLQQGIDTGDVPSGVDVLMDTAGAGEGRALMEIIHDLAPGAQLAFHTAVLGELDFAQGIHDLAQTGARVMVDDVAYLTEPFFQDGIVGSAVNDIVSRYGVVYVTAAGNGNGEFYIAPFRDAGEGRPQAPGADRSR